MQRSRAQQTTHAGKCTQPFKTQIMREGAAEKVPRMLRHVPDYFKMCKKAVEKDPWSLEYVPEDLITRRMCNKTVDDC